jgi:RNA polymerase sigma-70 factor (ECF subfamily)
MRIEAENGTAPSPTDEELMDRCGRGDAEGLAELIRRHGGPLYGYLLRLTRSRERAEDAYQEVWIRVMRSAKSYDQRDRFGAWLYTVARHLVIDQARSTQRRREERLEDPAGEDGLSPIEREADPGPDPEAELRGRELEAALEAALAGLAPEQREVFLLRERSGLSFAEIAALTRAPLNTVKTRMHYALGHLRRALAQKGFLDEG